MPTAETLHCPNCGAAISSDSAKCQFCAAALATVACPQCFGMMFVGSKFCPHCGAVAQPVHSADGTPLPCPKCKSAMNSVQIGNRSLFECPSCEGMWVDSTTLQQICDEREAASIALALPTRPIAPTTLDTNFHYISCPVCGQLMNRINFAHISGVILDVCRDHGTWFNRDELRRVIEFIRAGGLAKLRQRQQSDLEDQRERLNAARADAATPDTSLWTTDIPTRSNAILDVAGFLYGLFK